MSKLEQLINELCPDGVEYRKIKDIFKRLKGTAITAGKMKEISSVDGEVIIIAGGKTIIKAKEKDIPNSNIIRVPSVVVQSRGVIDVIYIENAFTFKNEMWAYTADEKITVKYLYYILKNNVDYLRQSASGMGSLPQISLTVTEDFQIPLPPLPVQEEIVRILDTFTELTAELTAELTMRKQQYEYFETTLLFDSKYPRVLLKDVCTVNQGLQIPINQRKTENGENRYFYITVQFLKGDNEDKYYIENPNESVICNLDDVLVTRTGSTGKIITGVHGCFHNNFFKVNCFNTINKRYMYYFLNSQVMFRKLLHTASGGTVPDLPHNKFYKLEIPLPSLEEQQRIVDILDRFDTLVNDIKTGLPAEIEARQKQYEYYRDKLLTFKKLEK